MCTAAPLLPATTHLTDCRPLYLPLYLRSISHLCVVSNPHRMQTRT